MGRDIQKFWEGRITLYGGLRILWGENVGNYKSHFACF